MTQYPIVEPEIDDYLKHLSETQIQEVIQHFHAKELKIAEIIEMYELDNIPVSNFVKKLPPEQCFELACPKCEVTAWVNQQRRGEKSVAYCPECKADLVEEYDPELRQRILQREQLFAEYYKRKDPNYYENEIVIDNDKFNSLSAFSKVFLGSIVQTVVEDDLSTVKGKLLKTFKLYPIESEVDAHLKDLGIQEGNNYTNYLYKIDPSITEQLLAPEKALNISTKDQFFLWKTIALAESKEYLTGEMKDNQLRYQHDNLFFRVFSHLLEDLSVAQTFHLIYKSVGDACKLYSKFNNRFQAENSVIGACDRMASHYTSKGWPINNYHRKKYYQSIMSQYFFNKVIKIGERGFNVPPSVTGLIEDKFQL